MNMCKTHESCMPTLFSTQFFVSAYICVIFKHYLLTIFPVADFTGKLTHRLKNTSAVWKQAFASQLFISLIPTPTKILRSSWWCTSISQASHAWWSIARDSWNFRRAYSVLLSIHQYFTFFAFAAEGCGDDLLLPRSKHQRILLRASTSLFVGSTS